jgi:hypothetical protein
MSPFKKRVIGPVTYYVVARYADTGERFEYYDFTTLRDAETFKVGYQERRDPPGRVSEVTIEVLPTRTFPEKFKPKI